MYVCMYVCVYIYIYTYIYIYIYIYVCHPPRELEEEREGDEAVGQDEGVLRQADAVSRHRRLQRVLLLAGLLLISINVTITITIIIIIIIFYHYHSIIVIIILIIIIDIIIHNAIGGLARGLGPRGLWPRAGAGARRLHGPEHGLLQAQGVVLLNIDHCV